MSISVQIGSSSTPQFSIWVPLIAVLIGAFATGLLQTIFRLQDRGAKRKSILTAIAAEVSSLCELIRLHNYQKYVKDIIVEFEKGLIESIQLNIEIRSSYFTVYESLGSDIGLIPFQNTTNIVNFYSKCNALIDCTRPDSAVTPQLKGAEGLRHFKVIDQLLTDILALGDAIVQIPETA